MKEKSKKKPRFIKPPNNFKQKVGSGGIDETLLEKSQEAINNSEFDFLPYAQQFLKDLSQFAKDARTREPIKRAARKKLLA